MEILLGVDSNYHTLQQRLIGLLGEGPSTNHRAAEIVKKRNDYMHRGLTLIDEDLSHHAINLALKCLVRYANVALLFQDRTQLYEYVDFVYRALVQRFNWSDDQIDAFMRLLRYDPYEPPLPYQTGKQIIPIGGSHLTSNSGNN
jgi:hypothetical protein